MGGGVFVGGVWFKILILGALRLWIKYCCA